MNKMFLLLFFVFLDGVAFAGNIVAGATISGMASYSIPSQARYTCIGASSCEGVSGDDAGLAMGMRDHLQDLVGIGVVDWVGDQQDPASNATYDVDHWGIGARRVTTILNDLDDFLDEFFPVPNGNGSFIILHCGGADIVFDEVDPETVAANVSSVVDIINAHDPSLNIIVSDSQPQDQGAANQTNTNLQLFSAELSDMVDAQVLAGKTNVYYLGLYEAIVEADGFPTSVLSGDNIHMNDGGYQLWANKIFEIIDAVP